MLPFVLEMIHNCIWAFVHPTVWSFAIISKNKFGAPKSDMAVVPSILDQVLKLSYWPNSIATRYVNKGRAFCLIKIHKYTFIKFDLFFFCYPHSKNRLRLMVNIFVHSIIVCQWIRLDICPLTETVQCNRWPLNRINLERPVVAAADTYQLAYHIQFTVILIVHYSHAFHTHHHILFIPRITKLRMWPLYVRVALTMIKNTILLFS